MHVAVAHRKHQRSPPAAQSHSVQRRTVLRQRDMRAYPSSFSLASSSAPASMSISTVRVCPVFAANISAVHLHTRSVRIHGERHAHSARPYPPLIWAATSASALISRSTKCAWPQATAQMSAVHLRTRLESDSPQQLHSVFGARRPYPSLALADTSALAAMSSSTTRMLPLPTAAMSAVHQPHTRLGSDGARHSHSVWGPTHRRPWR